MKKFLLLALFSLKVWAASPEKGKERVILRTLSGDIVLAFYPKLAPETSAQILKLFNLGVYQGMHFYRLEPNFVAQLSTAYDRQPPLNSMQQAALHPIKAEFSSVPHRRGILSMARMDNDVNSGESSFSILMGEAPHLDGKYTVFGEVESGMDVVDQLFQVPRKPGTTQPQPRIEVLQTVVLKSAEELAKFPLQRARPYPYSAPASEASAPTPFLGGPVGVGLLVFLAAFNVGLFFLAEKLSLALMRSLVLLEVFVLAFFLFVALVPLAQQNRYLATLVFFGMIGLFKLFGRFEAPISSNRTA